MHNKENARFFRMQIFVGFDCDMISDTQCERVVCWSIISSTMPVFVCLDHRLTVKRSSHQWSISHSAQSTHKHSCFLIVKWPREIFFCDHSCCCKYVYLWCLFLKKGAIKNCFCETKGLAQRISMLCWHNEPSDHGQNDDDCCCSLTRFNIEPFNGFACAGHERV